MNKAAPMIRGTKTPPHAMSKAFGPVLSKSESLFWRPAENIKSITPISAITARKSDCPTIPNTLGPMNKPATISPTTCGSFMYLAAIPRHFAAMTMIARSRNVL